MQDTFTLAIGSNKVQVVQKLYPGFRTEKQFNTVKSIVLDEEFDYCLCDIFTPESSKSTYQGPFVFLWYDKKQKLHGVRIGKTGKILYRSKNI